MGEVDLAWAAGRVSAAGTLALEVFGPGAAVVGVAASEAVGSDEGVELLKAVSLGCVCAFEAQERFSAG